MRTRTPPRTFASGELAPWLDGISNALTQQGCRLVENFIVRKQGQATRRPGTFYVADTKSDGEAILVPATIDDDNRYVLEIGDAYIRVYNQPTHAYLTEIASPWSVGEISSLCIQYSANDKTMYLSQAAHPLQKLVYSSGTSWAIHAAAMQEGYPPVVMSVLGKLAVSEDGETWTEETITIDSENTADGALGRARSNLLVDHTGVLWIGAGDRESWYSHGAVGAAAFFDFETNYAGVAFGVGTEATSGCIYVTRDDGVTWTKKGSTAGGQLYGIATDRVRDEWMAVGVGARAYALSTDANVFTSISETAQLWGVDYGSDLWVAVGLNTIRHAASITAAWTSVAMTGTLYDVTHGTPGGSDLWVAVGVTAGGNAVIYSSPTGSVWTQRYNSNAYAGAFLDAKWVGNLYVAVGQTPGSDKNGVANTGTIFATSPDGINWTVNPTLSRAHAPGWNRIVWRPEQNATGLSDSSNFPRTIGYQDGRLLVVPHGKPSRIMGSKIGVFSNFYLGELANEAFEYDILGDFRNVDIQWIMGGLGGLLVGTRTAEGILLGSPDEGITPATAQFKWLSTFGSNGVQPVRVGNMIIFVQRGGEIVRGYRLDLTWQSPELTAFADHITDGGVTELDHQEDPQGIVHFIRSDGQAPGLTLDGQTVAWWRTKAASSLAGAAVIESHAVTPTSGSEDEVWQIVRRTIGGGTKRHIEYYSTIAVPSYAGAHYVDDGVEVTSGTTFQTMAGLSHLAGERVDALINGSRWLASLSVGPTGTISLAPYSGTDVHAGLAYTSYLQTMRGDYGSPYGDGAGLLKRTSELFVWVSDSSAAAKFGPTSTLCTETITYANPGSLNTNVCLVNFPGQWDRDNYIWCQVSDPKPFTMVAMLADSVTGDG